MSHIWLQPQTVHAEIDSIEQYTIPMAAKLVALHTIVSVCLSVSCILHMFLLQQLIAPAPAAALQLKKEVCVNLSQLAAVLSPLTHLQVRFLKALLAMQTFAAVPALLPQGICLRGRFIGPAISVHSKVWKVPQLLCNLLVRDLICSLCACRYELHHGVRINDTALVEAAIMSDRYIADRFLPDKAIDLIDEAAAKLKMEITSKPLHLDEIDRKV